MVLAFLNTDTVLFTMIPSVSAMVLAFLTADSIVLTIIVGSLKAHAVDFRMIPCAFTVSPDSRVQMP